MASDIISNSHVSREDIIGLEETKKFLENTFVLPIKRPELYKGAFYGQLTTVR